MGADFRLCHHRRLLRGRLGGSARPDVALGDVLLGYEGARAYPRRRIWSLSSVITDARFSRRVRHAGSEGQSSHQCEQYQFAFHGDFRPFELIKGSRNRSARTTSGYAIHRVVRAIAPTAFA